MGKTKRSEATPHNVTAAQVKDLENEIESLKATIEEIKVQAIVERKNGYALGWNNIAAFVNDYHDPLLRTMRSAEALIGTIKGIVVTTHPIGYLPNYRAKLGTLGNHLTDHLVDIDDQHRTIRAKLYNLVKRDSEKPIYDYSYFYAMRNATLDYAKGIDLSGDKLFEVASQHQQIKTLIDGVLTKPPPKVEEYNIENYVQVRRLINSGLGVRKALAQYSSTLAGGIDINLGAVSRSFYRVQKLVEDGLFFLPTAGDAASVSTFDSTNMLES